MRLSRLLLAIPLARAPRPGRPRRRHRDFLKPENWEGRTDIWKLDPKARTIVGETKEDPKYNTFLCTKKKYGDFELTCKVQLRDGVGNSGVQIRSEVSDNEEVRRRAARRWTSARATGAASTARASAG